MIEPRAIFSGASEGQRWIAHPSAVLRTRR
jgi:hypothetical protein